MFENEIGEMGWVSLTMRVGKFSQTLTSYFSLGQRRWGDSREIKDSVQLGLGEGEFCMLHLAFKGYNESNLNSPKILIGHTN